jgi:hypothetical protein
VAGQVAYQRVAASRGEAPDGPADAGQRLVLTDLSNPDLHGALPVTAEAKQ